MTGSEPALPRPPELANCKILLYSGNCGVAHEIETVIAGLARHHRDGSGRFGLWLNATGRNADRLEAGLRDAGVPVARGKTVPLDQLAGSADGCGCASGDIAAAVSGLSCRRKSMRAWRRNDPLCLSARKARMCIFCVLQARMPSYRHVDPGDPAAFAAALERLADWSGLASSDSPDRLDRISAGPAIVSGHDTGVR